MPISSLIVRTQASQHDCVIETLATHPAIEVGHVGPGSIAVITETPGKDADTHLWKQIEAIDGVTHVELIYHNFEDLEGSSNAIE